MKRRVVAETLQHSAGGVSWKWHSIMKDLEEQGGLPNVEINPFTVDLASCGGKHDSTSFAISWVHEVFMLLTMDAYSEALVDAFTKVLEYRPFCRYIDQNGLETVEWDKHSPDDRFKELTEHGKQNLQRLS